MMQHLVETTAKLDYKQLSESLIRTFGVTEAVNWESTLPAAQQQQLFGGEILRTIADHPTLAQQHDIRALCWPKGTVSQLLFLFVRLGDNRLPKSQIERITRKFIGGLDAERYTVWFFGNEQQTMLKVVLAGREGKKTVCKTLTLEAGQWYKTYDYILDTVVAATHPASQGNLFSKGEPSLLWKAIWKAFDISIVNRKFYADIKLAFDSLITSLAACKGILTRPEQRTQFAVRLLGRLIFCWFLKKKGIVGSSALSSATVAEYTNYYHELLEPLFFDVFNTPENARKSGLPASIAKLRFLNGGLFEPQTDDCQDNFQLFLPNDWFAGFFGNTLERYNFTVDENSASNAEIAIDPEMLGRIFENLLAEQNPETGESARNRTGSFYTPREIVDYMVEESLISYLGEEHADFVHTAETDKLSSASKQKLQEKLTSLKTIDIAAGSGAFPMGMLQKVVMLKQALSPKTSPYSLKLETIENSIYGVDIQPMAIELSRLRCWLSLIVDEEPETVQPLPNLDFKFVCADSLIDLGYEAFRDQCEKKHGLLFLGDFEQKMAELKQIRHDYFDSAHNHGHKQELKKRFQAIQGDILNISLDLVKQNLINAEFTHRIVGWNPFDDSKAAPFFSPAWMFGIEAARTLPPPAPPKIGGEPCRPLLAKEGVGSGFDICIGNPPYIQIQSFSGQPVQKAWEEQKYATFAKTGDVYCLFYERGFNLLAQNGTLAYITSNKWMRAGYGKAMRKFFLNNGALSHLIDFGDSQIFENATTYTNILLWHKQAQTSQVQAWDLSKAYSADTSLPTMLEKQGAGDPLFTEDSFVIASGEQAMIKKRIEEVGLPLKQWDVSIYRGVLTGLNEAFIISGKKKDELIAQDPKSAEIIKPILRGRDIKRYKADFADLWLINSHNGYGNVPRIDVPKDYPAVWEHLQAVNAATNAGLERRQDKGAHWSNLRNCAYVEDFKAEKNIWLEMSPKPNFLCDTSGFFVLNTAYILTGNALKYLLAALNSTTLDFYFPMIATEVRGATRRYIKQYVEQLPIPQISTDAQLPYECLVDCIQYAYQQGLTSEAATFEWVINVMVYGLYFEEEMKQANCYINDLVAKVVKPFRADDSDQFKTEYVQKLNLFFLKDKDIYYCLTHSRNVKPVEIIVEARKK